MRGLLLAVLIAAATPVGGAGVCRSLNPIRWLLGAWTTHNEDRVTTETWTEASADTFEGIVTARSRATGEIVPVETLRLVAMSGGVFYIAKVPEHALPVSFEMTACDERTAVVENPGHDFPRMIAYRLAEDGVLSVSVTDGADEGFTLRYTRGGADTSGHR